jgi:DNA-binding NarL/FixJ family response regulator
VRTNSILAAVAELFVGRGEPLQAVTVLVPILRDPATDRETSDRARALLSRCTAQLAPDQRAAATHGHRVIDVPVVLAMLSTASTGTELLPTPGGNGALTPAPVHPLTPTAQIGKVLVEPLTARELVVLHLLAAGQSNQAIATRLTIAPSTAKWYVSQILGKLGVHSRTQAIAHARELGLLA